MATGKEGGDTFTTLQEQVISEIEMRPLRAGTFASDAGNMPTVHAQIFETEARGAHQMFKKS